MAERTAARVEEQVDSIDGGLCADIEGLPGSGRSTLLHALGRGLRERGRQVVRLHGVRALRDQPLGAISVRDEFGPQLRGPSVHDATRQLVKQLGSARSVLIVDDVDDLDVITGGVVYAARAELGMPVVVSRRPGTDRDGVVRALVPGLQPGVLVRLGPLAFAEVHELLHDALPDSVDSALVAHIAVMSGGLPGLAKAFAAAARAEGRIALGGGVWRTVTDAWQPSFGHAVAPLLRDLEQEDVDALTLLALGGTQAVTPTRRLVDVGRLQRLERMGLVAVTQEPGGDLVSVFPPALGEYVVKECGPLRRHLLQAHAASELALGAVTPAEPSPAHNLEDALSAKRLSDHWRAERRVLMDRWTKDPTARRAVPLVVAMLALGESPEPIVRQTRQGDGPADAELQAWFAVHLAVHERGIEAAGRYASALRAGPARRLAEATVRYLELLFDHVPAMGELVPASGESTALELEVLRQAAVECEVASGNVKTARILASESAPTCPLIHRHLDATLSLARILDGDVRAGTDAAVTATGEAMRQMDPGAVQLHAYAAAFGLIIGGRFSELDALVASALTVAVRTPAEEHYRAGVIALAAIAARWQGRRQFARRLALQARALDDRPGPFPGMLPGTLLALSRSGNEEQARTVWQLAEERLSKGYVAAGVFCAVAALRSHPSPDRAARVLAAATSCESAALRALAHHAVAIGTDDPDAIEASRPLLAACGLRAYEVHALITEALASHRRGAHDRALTRIESAWDVASTFGGPQTGFFEPFVEALGLSSREVEIMEMVASGLTTNQIASELSISPRTVENHVFSCYRKTGFGNREDMTRAVSTWLAAPL